MLVLSKCFHLPFLSRDTAGQEIRTGLMLLMFAFEVMDAVSLVACARCDVQMMQIIVSKKCVSTDLSNELYFYYSHHQIAARVLFVEPI